MSTMRVSGSTKRVMSYIFKYKRTFSIAIIALLVVACSLLMLGRSIENFTNNYSTNYANALTSITVLVVVFGIASFIRSYFINTSAQKISDDVMRDAYISISRMSARELEIQGISQLSNTINSSVESVNKIVTDMTSFLLRNFIMCLGGFIMMFTTCYQLAFLSVTSVSIVVLIVLIIGKKLRSLSKEVEHAKASVTHFIYETILNIKIVKVFHAEENVLEHFDRLHSISMQKNGQRFMIRSQFFAIAISSILLTIVAVLWYGSHEVMAGNIRIGTLTSFIFYALMGATSLGGIAEGLSDIQKHVTNVDKIFEIIDYRSDDSVNFCSNSDAASKISMKNVTFHYPTRVHDIILDDLSLNFDTGVYTTITGESGSGKSTILQLLSGVYKPVSGQISLCGIKSVAYVAQDAMLFSGTILENITFFSQVNDEAKRDILALLHDLRLANIIEALPDGIDTHTGDMAMQLSGGQRQRLAIARALVRKPDLLLLDEATSQLDEETEVAVISTIKKIMHGKTVVSVAHRKSAIEAADIIVSLDNIRTRSGGFD